MGPEIYDYKSAFSACARAVNTVKRELPKAEKPKSSQKTDHVDFSDNALETIKEAVKSAREKTESCWKEQAEFCSEKTAEAAETAVEKTEAADTAEKPKTLSDMIKEQMEKIDSLFAEPEYDKSKDARLLSIKSKLFRGLTLNSSEQQYLASKDPDSYKTFQQTESARKMFRCSLRACRTRDEVISMRLSNALTALSEYKKATRKGGDGNAIAGLNYALENEIKSYASSADYQRLPTVAECNKFDRELAKAKRYECEKRREEMKARIDRKYKKKHKTVGDGKRTVAQVMSSPLARKVLASRRRSGSCSCGMTADNSLVGNIMKNL